MYQPNVGIIGIGMVGGPIARYFAEIKKYERGKNLFLYDIDVKKNYGDDVSRADVIFICVPSPRNPKDGSCDTSLVSNAIKKINGTTKIIVIKSTVPPGTTERLQQEYPQHKLLFNPEFLTESRAWDDMLRPDRQIVGFTKESLDAAHLVLSLLPKAPFMSPWGVGTYQPVRITATEAEFIKYAGNVYFVRKVNWANALAKAAEQFGANYENIRKGMSADHRIGDSHLDVNHGGYRGWGGYCFPKDLDGFIQFAKSNTLHDISTLLEADRRFNEELLRAQGLSLEEVSHHDHIIEHQMKEKKGL